MDLETGTRTCCSLHMQHRPTHPATKRLQYRMLQISSGYNTPYYLHNWPQHAVMVHLPLAISPLLPSSLCTPAASAANSETQTQHQHPIITPFHPIQCM
jgi:hypothetical protein